jgi:hypothetical protein
MVLCGALFCSGFPIDIELEAMVLVTAMLVATLVIKRFYKSRGGNDRLFFATFIAVIVTYTIDILTGHSQIFSIVGHIFEGAFFVEIIYQLYFSKDAALQSLVAFAGALTLAFMFQAFKFYHLNPVPGLTDLFQTSKLVFTVVGTIIAIVYGIETRRMAKRR